MNLEKIKSIIQQEWHLPYGKKIMNIINSFSLTEKVIFYIAVILLTISGLSLLYQVNKHFLVEVPDYGGSVTEGIIGSPRFVNPLLASSDIDKDLTALIYSGLMRAGENNTLIPDLAEKYTVSDDGLTYTFTLKDNVYFHDGVRVTADDVIFTIEKAKDPLLKSPRESSWMGVRVERIDEKTINFVLSQPYSPFIYNTTIGILPKHIWTTASIESFPFSQFNIKPVGSGPYKIDSITYTSSGLPSEYKLKSFEKYSLGKPYITNLTIKSYQNEKDVIEAYKNGHIEMVHSISPKKLPDLKSKDGQTVLSPLPRVFGLFFNQNIANVFVNKEVRQALNVGANKQEIVDVILGGFGQPINGAIPPKDILSGATDVRTNEERVAEARAVLEKAGWRLNDNGIFEKIANKKVVATLSFSISTGDTPELKETALLLEKQWEEIGANVDVKIFEIGDLNQNIIKPRKYDSLLFGEVIGRDLDLYPFWHSSGRTTPGLNIALYTNIKVDRALENLRKATSESEKEPLFNTFNTEIRNDVPAVFTYSPYFIYIVPEKIKNVTLGTLNSPGERFNNINEWYIETNNVWGIFSDENN